METAANRPLGSKFSMMCSTEHTLGLNTNALASETAAAWHQQV